MPCSRAIRPRRWSLLPYPTAGKTRLPVMLALAAAVYGGPTCAITVEEAVQLALSSNPQVLGAQADVRAAGFDVKQARAGYLPSVDLNNNIGREHSNIKQLGRGGHGDSDLWRRESGLVVSQLLWDGNATRSEVRRRAALLNSAEHSLADTQNAIAFRAVEVYLDVLRNRELVELARENLKAHDATLQNVQAKQTSGVGNNADVQQARARVALAASTLTSRQGSLLEAAARYERVTGQPPAELAKPNVTLSGLVKNGAVDVAELRSATEAAQQKALTEHPAVLRAAANVEAAAAAIKAAMSAFHPRVNLEGTLDRDDDVAGVSGVRNSEAIMVVARWNLFRGGADRAQQMAATERKESADEQMQDTYRSIAENVAIAFESRATSESRLGQLQQYVASSAGTLDAYEAQFALNRRTLLDVLNAEGELFNARSNLVVGAYDDAVNSYFIEASKGALAGKLGAAAAAR